MDCRTPNRHWGEDDEEELDPMIGAVQMQTVLEVRHRIRSLRNGSRPLRTPGDSAP